MVQRNVEKEPSTATTPDCLSHTVPTACGFVLLTLHAQAVRSLGVEFDASPQHNHHRPYKPGDDVTKLAL